MGSQCSSQCSKGGSNGEVNRGISLSVQMLLDDNKVRVRAFDIMNPCICVLDMRMRVFRCMVQ